MIPALTAVAPTKGDSNPLATFRVGQVIEAEVEAISENGIVRLLVAGMTVPVSSAANLVPGSVVKLLVKQDGKSGLILELKRSETDQRWMHPAPTHSSTSLAGVGGRGLLSALLDIGTALSAASSGVAALARTGSIDATSRDRGGSTPLNGDDEAGTPTAPQMHSGLVLDAKRETTLRQSSLPLPSEAKEHSNDPEARLMANPQIRSTPDQPTAPHSTVMNYAFPGVTERLQIAVTHRDEGHEGNEETPSGQAHQSIEARFGIDSPALGRVHVVMRKHGSAISIGLWAERPEVAAELLRERAELQDELGAADVEIEALEVFVGAPSVAVSAALTPAGSVVS